MTNLINAIGIMAVTIIEVTALMKGIDGALLMLSLFIIGVFVDKEAVLRIFSNLFKRR